MVRLEIFHFILLHSPTLRCLQVHLALTNGRWIKNGFVSFYRACVIFETQTVKVKDWPVFLAFLLRICCCFVAEYLTAIQAQL